MDSKSTNPKRGWLGGVILSQVIIYIRRLSQRPTLGQMRKGKLFGNRVESLNVLPKQAMYRFPSPSAYAEAMLTRNVPWSRMQLRT